MWRLLTDHLLPNEATRRRRASEGSLTAKGVLVNPRLPCIEVVARVHPAAPARAMRRLCVLSGLAAWANGCPHARVQDWLGHEGLLGDLSEEESQSLSAGRLAPNTHSLFNLQIFAAWQLAWALELVPQVDYFARCPDDLAFQVPFPGAPAAPFLDRARLRPTPELLDQTDFLYRLCWAAREAKMTNRPAPSCNSAPCLLQCLRAMNWLLEPGIAWEDVDTST